MSPDLAGSLRAYAALVRLPNLFTAPPDVVLGAALAAGAGATASFGSIVGLAVASILLYAAGTTLNDYADAPADARERPERPIPSGEVSRRSAFALATGLLASAVAVAYAAAGPVGGGVAAALAFAVALYDFAFKGSAIGFLFMGAARGLNVILGTTVGGSPLDLSPDALAVPVVVVAYIAAVTYMAAGETRGDNRTAVGVAAGGALVAAIAVGGRLVTTGQDPVAAALAVGLALLFLAWAGRPLRRAYAEPVPETVGPAVGACVLALVLLDGAFAATVGVRWALGAVAFVVPAVGLSRVFDVT